MGGYKGLFVDKLVAKNGDRFASDSIVVYNDAYDYTSFPDNGHITKLMLITAMGGLIAPLRIPFTSSTGPVINWQTDLADGVNTYFELFSNRVEAFVYRTDFGLPLGQPYTWTVDGSNNVNVVTFAFGDTATGYIKWG